MLSKPYARIVGRQQRARRRRSAPADRARRCAYSARFRRCSSGRPGLGCADGRAVELRARASASALSAAAGVGPRRALRRHHARPQLADDLLPDLRLLADVRRSIFSNETPAVLSRSLWHVAQDLGDLGLMPARRGGRGNGSRLWRARRLWRGGKQHERQRQQGHRAPPLAPSRAARCALRVAPGLGRRRMCGLLLSILTVCLHVGCCSRSRTGR